MKDKGLWVNCLFLEKRIVSCEGGVGLFVHIEYEAIGVSDMICPMFMNMGCSAFGFIEQYCGDIAGRSPGVSF